ncbi:MAG: TonB-dependent receptor [Caenibius sp.]
MQKMFSGSVTGAMTALAVVLAGQFAVSTQALAQDASGAASSDGGFQGGEIVVTATKREQSLSDVGLTISAFSGDQLEKQGVNDIADLANITPGLTFAPTPNATPVYTIRGVGFFEASLAAYPSVSLYLDQVPLSLPAMTSLTAFDLERVEVLKGPQGTLFGNNATSGAINFVAAKPTDVFHAGVDLGYARFNTISGSAFVSGPITDTLKGRVAVNFSNGDEWQYSNSRRAGGVDADLLAIGVPASASSKADKIGKKDEIAGRLILDWEPTDSLRFSFNLNGWRNQSDPQSPQYVEARPQNPIGSAGLGGVVGADLPIFNYPAALGNARVTDWNPERRPYANDKFWQTSLRADYDVTDDLTLTSITGYSKLKTEKTAESDGTPFDTLELDPITGDLESVTTELRLANSGANRLRFQLGANYEHTTVKEREELFISGTSSFALNGFGGNNYGSDQTMNNYAAFGNIEFDVTDTVTIKGGIRQTKAKRSNLTYSPWENPGQFVAGGLLTDSPCPLTGFFNTVYGVIYGAGTVPTIACGDGIAIDNRTNADGSPVNPATYLTTAPFTGKLNEDSTSWSAGIDFKPIDDLLLYANVSRGFKAGSFATLAGAIYDAYAPVTQEKLTDYEAGFKWQFADRRMSLTGAAFYYDYRDKQLRSKFVDPIFNALDKLVNVPKSRVYGAEMSLSGSPVDGLTVGASFTYLDAKVSRYDGVVGSVQDPVSTLWSPVIASFKGADLPFAPEWQYSVRADYEFPLSDTFNGFFGAGVHGQSSSIGTLTVDPVDQEAYKINARALVDGNIGVATADGRWRVQVWGKNIFNKLYWTQTNLAYDNIVRYTGRPAEYGLKVSYRY